jgi:hypothetical protein
MVEIKIKKYGTRTKGGLKYYVSIGNEQIIDFSNKRQMERFLASLSKAVTSHLKDINDIYTKVVNESQSLIFDFNDYRDIEKYNILKSAIDERMYFVSCRYSTDEAGFYINKILLIGQHLDNLIGLVLRALEGVKFQAVKSYLNTEKEQLRASLFHIRQLGNVDIKNLNNEKYDTGILAAS